MVAEDDICKYVSQPTFYVWFDLVFFSLLASATVAFSFKFLRQLSAQQRGSDALSGFVQAYIIQALIISLFVFYATSLEFFRQKDFGLNLTFCGFCNFLGMALLSGIYITLQHVLFVRLHVAFDNTKWKVSRRMRTAVRVFHALAFGFLFAMAILYGAFSDCFYENKSVGVHWTVYWCAPRPKNNYPIAAAFYILGFILIFGNTTLAYMYLWRLRVALLGTKEMRQKKRAAKKQRRAVPQSMASQSSAKTMTSSTDSSWKPPRKKSAAEKKRESATRKVIRKSTVVAIVSVLSTLLAFVLYGFFGIIMEKMVYLDTFFNLVLLYCLYAFGDDLYQNVFARFHCCVDPFIPSNAFSNDDIVWDLSVTQTQTQTQTHTQDSTTDTSNPKPLSVEITATVDDSMPAIKE